MNEYKNFVEKMCEFFNKQTLEYLYGFEKIEFIIEDGVITNYEI